MSVSNDLGTSIIKVYKVMVHGSHHSSVDYYAGLLLIWETRDPCKSQFNIILGLYRRVTYHLGMRTWDSGELQESSAIHVTMSRFTTWVDRMLDSEIASNSQLGNWVDRTRDPWIAPGIAGETGTVRYWLQYIPVYMD